MRRIPLTLAATGALVPLAVSATAVPASAASSSLIITTVGRSGADVASTATVIPLSTGAIYTVRTGKRLALPKGRYAVLLNIQEQDATLGGRVVSVSGKTSVTFDARQGQPIKVSLDSNPGPGYEQRIEARVCAGPSAFPSAQVSGVPGRIFAIPNSAKDLHFAYLASWRGADAYLVSGVTSGVPKNPGGAFRSTDLAKVNIQARSGPAAGRQTAIAFQPQPSPESCQTDLYGVVRDDDAPYSVKAHVSPGRWVARSDTFALHGIENWDVGAWFASPRSFVGGQTYSQVFNRAVWGPVHNIPQVYRKSIVYFPDNLMADPVVSGSDTSAKASFVLSKDGKVLKKQTLSELLPDGDQEFSARIGSAGWYTLDVDAHRYDPDITFPADLLSSRVTIGWRFHAEPATSEVAPAFLTRFVPGGLDGSNRAKPGSTTSVAVSLDRRSQSPDVPFHKVSAKSVQVWASADDGKTWQAITVERTGTRWTAHVPNPASGAVALRSKVLDSHGNSSVVTVYRAYAIG